MVDLIATFGTQVEEAWVIGVQRDVQLDRESPFKWRAVEAHHVGGFGGAQGPANPRDQSGAAENLGGKRHG